MGSARCDRLGHEVGDDGVCISCAERPQSRRRENLGEWVEGCSLCEYERLQVEGGLG